MADSVFSIELSNGIRERTVRALARVRQDQMRLHIPRSIVEQLGLRVERISAASTMLMALNCNVTLFGRSETMRAVVDHENDVCSLGAFLLMALDLIVDPITGLPKPRDPNDYVIDI